MTELNQQQVEILYSMIEQITGTAQQGNYRKEILKVSIENLTADHHGINGERSVKNSMKLAFSRNQCDFYQPFLARRGNLKTKNSKAWSPLYTLLLHVIDNQSYDLLHKDQISKI